MPQYNKKKKIQGKFDPKHSYVLFRTRAVLLKPNSHAAEIKTFHFVCSLLE